MIFSIFWRTAALTEVVNRQEKHFCVEHLYFSRNEMSRSCTATAREKNNRHLDSPSERGVCNWSARRPTPR